MFSCFIVLTDKAAAKEVTSRGRSLPAYDCEFKHRQRGGPEISQLTKGFARKPGGWACNFGWPRALSRRNHYARISAHALQDWRWFSSPSSEASFILPARCAGFARRLRRECRCLSSALPPLPPVPWPSL